MDSPPVRITPRRPMRRWSAAVYGAFFVLFALPFATLYAACSHERIDTVNGYQTLSSHTYAYQAADGSSRVVTIGADGFAWTAIALVAAGIVLSLIGLRPVWLAGSSVLAVIALFLASVAAGASRASSRAEIGFWLSAAAIAFAPAADVRPWRRAAMVAAATVGVAVAVVAVLVGLIALTAQNSSR